MAIERTAEAVWTGSLEDGSGQLTTESRAILSAAYSFGTRFESQQGTNPEELLAAAHIGCYCMAFAHVLSGEGMTPERIEGKATCVLKPLKPEGFEISVVRLDVRAQVPEADEETIQELAEQADEVCVISNALRQGVDIELSAKLA